MKMSDYKAPPRGDRVLRLRAAKCIAERKPHETMASVADKAGCDKSSLYRWLDQDDFRELVKTLTDDMLVEYMPQDGALNFSESAFIQFGGTEVYLVEQMVAAGGQDVVIATFLNKNRLRDVTSCPP